MRRRREQHPGPALRLGMAEQCRETLARSPDWPGVHDRWRREAERWESGAVMVAHGWELANVWPAARWRLDDFNALYEVADDGTVRPPADPAAAARQWHAAFAEPDPRLY